MHLLGSMVIVPAIVCVITNTLIYWHVRSSSSRVQIPAASRAGDQPKISRRDIFLLRHMVIMFCVFLFGWTPAVIGYIVGYYTLIPRLLLRIVHLNFQLALLADMVDLLLYNHEVRRYLIGLCLSCCRT